MDDKSRLNIQEGANRPRAASISGPGANRPRAGSVPATNRPGAVPIQRPRAGSITSGGPKRPRAGSITKHAAGPKKVSIGGPKKVDFNDAESGPAGGKDEPDPPDPPPPPPRPKTAPPPKGKTPAPSVAGIQEDPAAAAEEAKKETERRKRKPKVHRHHEEESEKKKWILLDMPPTYTPALHSLLEEDADPDSNVNQEEMDRILEDHVDHFGWNILKNYTHLFITIGSPQLDEWLPDPDEVDFAHKYEITCGNTGDRLLLASETFQQLYRKGCCTDRSTQHYELVILTFQGKGLCTASRHENVITITDFTKDIAYITRTDKKPNRIPKNFSITDAETGKELLKIVPPPFEEPGEYEILLGEDDDQVGKISKIWTELDGGANNPRKDWLGLKVLKHLRPELKGYLIVLLFNTYFTFDEQPSEETGDRWTV